MVSYDRRYTSIDQRVAEKIRDMFAGKIERIIDRKAKAPVETFYAARNYAPIWIENGTENARGKAAAVYLAGVSADGLDPGVERSDVLAGCFFIEHFFVRRHNRFSISSVRHVSVRFETS